MVDWLNQIQLRGKIQPDITHLPPPSDKHLPQIPCVLTDAAGKPRTSPVAVVALRRQDPPPAIA
jgi:hypothetical protein